MTKEVNVTIKRMMLVLAYLAFCGTVRGQTNPTNNPTAALSTQGTSTSYTTTSAAWQQISTTQGVCAVGISGTWTGTISFYLSLNGQAPVAASATPSNSSTAVTTTTGNGAWTINCGGYSVVYAIFTTASSGTANVTINPAQVSRSGGGGGGGSGTVTSVSGTTNQIDVATGTTTPVVSVDATFLFPGTFGYSSLGTGTFNAIGTTPTDANLLTNTTAAAAGAQQYSPGIHWTGQGWKTTATAASQTVDFRAYVIPVQGTTHPSGQWRLESQVNGGGYSLPLIWTTGGQLQTSGGSATVPAYAFSSAAYGWYERAIGVLDQADNGATPNEFFYVGGAAGMRQGSDGVFAWTGTAHDATQSSDTGVSRVSAGVVGIGTGASGNVAGTIQSGKYATGTTCIANGTAASPSVAACGSAAAGMFSCATNASGATCQVNTTAVTANSSISITQNAADGGASQLNVTCNTASDLPATAPILASKSAGTSFTINVGTITTNPACFEYTITN